MTNLLEIVFLLIKVCWIRFFVVLMIILLEDHVVVVQLLVDDDASAEAAMQFCSADIDTLLTRGSRVVDFSNDGKVLQSRGKMRKKRNGGKIEEMSGSRPWLHTA